MNHEMPPQLEDDINEWYEANLKRNLKEACAKVQELGGKTTPTEEEVIETVKNANQLLKETSNGDMELYNYYKYRVFYQDQKYFIIWGEEVNLDEP